MNALLPAESDWRAFVDPHRYNDWVRRESMAMIGVPIIGGPMVRDFPTSPAVGIAGGIQDGEVWIDAAVPAPDDPRRGCFPGSQPDAELSADSRACRSRAAAGHSTKLMMGRDPLRAGAANICAGEPIDSLGRRIATRSARFPAVMLPTSASRPRASAPASVPIRRISCGSMSVWARDTCCISANRLRSGLEARLSVPSATRTPCFSAVASG